MLSKWEGMHLFVNARAIIERETPAGTEVLLQVAERPGDAPTLEFPGGRIEEFEPVLEALSREVREETGLRVTRILDDAGRTVRADSQAEVECLRPFCVYQTTRGPVDSTGYFFRCEVAGELTQQGDAASGHRWVPVAELARQWHDRPDDFHWLTRAVLGHYLTAIPKR